MLVPIRFADPRALTLTRDYPVPSRLVRLDNFRGVMPDEIIPAGSRRQMRVGELAPGLQDKLEDIGESAQTAGHELAQAGDRLTSQVKSTGFWVGAGLAMFGLGILTAALISRSRPPVVLMLTDKSVGSYMPG